MRFYLTYRNRGLYDPVLDDAEVIYIPVDPEESGAVNIQTDVQQQEKSEIIEPYQRDPAELVKPVDRQLEPAVESLALLINIDEIPPEGKFRLPISEQYDPEGRRVKVCKINGKKAVKFDIKQIIREDNEERAKLQTAQETVRDLISENKIKQEQENREVKSNFFQKEKEIDLNVLKEKALEIVSESIERAISVAKEVNEDVKNELASEKKYLAESKVTKDLSKTAEEKSEEVNIRRESTKEEYDVKVSEEIKKFEKVDIQSESSVEERKLRTKQEIDETIESGTVSKRSEIFNKENIEVSQPIDKQNERISKIILTRDKSVDSEAKHRVFSIGLQTIPNIKEKFEKTQVDYRLKLLTTFFLQLTNVMIALTKIILAQPMYVSQDLETQKQERNKDEKTEETELDKSENKSESFQHQEGQGLSKFKYDYDSHVSEGELIRKGRLSGAKIAQIEGRKPPELTDKMDIVISEFQRKTGCEDQSHGQFFRSRSGSRSKMKSEEDTSYSGSHRTSETDRRKTYEEFSETKTRSYEIREMKSAKRTFESTSKTESRPQMYETMIIDGKNLTYIAIVEAHVYTNKDAIFEEQMRRESEKREIERTIQDAQTLSLADTVIIPLTEEISLKDIENARFDVQQSKRGIEQSAIKIAAKTISEVIEPLIHLNSDKTYSVKKVHTILKPFESIIQSTDVSTEEFQQYYLATTVLSQIIYPSLEQPTKSAVEITEIALDENETEDLEVSQLIEEQSVAKMEDARSIAETTEILLKEDEIVVLEQDKPHLEKPREVVESNIKSVAETTEVITDTNLETLVASEKIIKTPRVTIESAFKSAAETITIMPEENRSEFVEGIKIKQETAKIKIDETFLPIAEQTRVSIEEPKQEELPWVKPVTVQARIDVNKSVATEVSEVSVMEQKADIFNLPETKIVQSKLSIEESAFCVAQMSCTSPVEPETHIEIMAKTDQIANIKFGEQKAVESTIVNLEEPGHDIFEAPETIEKKPLTSMEISHLTVAEKLVIVPQAVVANITDRHFSSEQANIEIEKFNASQTDIVIAEEMISDSLEMRLLKEQKTKVEIENPYLALAETLVILPEEPKEIISGTKVKTQQVQIGIDELEAIETTAVSLAEPEYVNLEIPQIVEKESQFTFSSVPLTVAEIKTVLPEEPKDEIFDVKKIKECTPSIDIVGIKAAETTIVCPEEAKSKELEVARVEEKQPDITIEDLPLTVAEVIFILPGETKGELNVPEIKNQQAEIKILEQKAAQALVVVAEESKQPELKTEQLNEQHPKPTLEPSNLSVAEVFATTTVESSKQIPSINITEILKNDQKILIEDTPLTVAEVTNVLSVGPKDEPIEIPKIVECKSAIDITGIKVAETIIVQTEEPKFENLVVAKLEEKHSETSVERSHLTVAEVKSMLPEEPKSGFEVPELKSQKAEIKILELKAADTIVVEALESKQLEINLEQLNRQKTLPIMEPSNLSVAEVLTTTISESSKEISEVEKIQKQQARVEVTEHKALETTEVALGDLNYKELKILAHDTKKLKTTVEETVQTVAEKTEVYLTEAENKIPIITRVTAKEANVTFNSLKPLAQESIAAIEVVESDVKKSKIISNKANVTLVESTATAVEETTLVSQAKEDTFKQYDKEVRNVEEKQTKIAIERPSLAVAEIVTLLPQESKTEFDVKAAYKISRSSEDKARKASLILQPIKPVEQESVVALEVVENDINKKSKLVSAANVAIVESTATSVQEVVAVAEVKQEDYKSIGRDVQADLVVEKSRSAKAQIQEVNIQEASKVEKAKYSAEYIKDINLDAQVSHTQQSLRKHISHAALKSTEVLAAESKFESETKEIKVKKASKAKATEIKEIEIKTRESESLSPTSPLSPTTPIIEEYVFLLEAELEHPYVVEAGVTEEALLRLKAERKKQIESADTSYTLAIESTIEVDSEAVEEIEEIEDVHISKEFVAQTEGKVETYKGIKSKTSARMDVESNKLKSAEAHSLDVNQQILVKKQTAMSREEAESFSSQAHKALQSGKLKSSTSTEMKSIESSQDLSSQVLGHDASYKLSLKKSAAGGDEAHLSLSIHKSLPSREIESSISEMGLSSIETSQDISNSTVGHDASYKLSLEQASVMEDESRLNQTSQKSQSRTRKVKSSKSKHSADQETGSSLQIMEAGSLEDSMRADSAYTSASHRQQSSFESKSMESSMIGDFKSEIYQQVSRASGSREAELHIASEFQSLEASVKSGGTQYSATVVEDLSNASALKERLTLRTDLGEAITNGLPMTSPPTVPPTPLTDEYIFRLQTEMPDESPFIQRDCSISPDSMHEDLIVNGLIPHYRTTVGRRIVYSPPLPTPPTSPEETKPIYTKPGLKGGSIRRGLTKEEILELRQKSKLLSAIDPLRQIEDYKASIGTTKDMSWQENVEEELPIYVVEEWVDDEDEENEANKSDFEVDAIKITIVTEDTEAGDTVTVTAEKDDDKLEIEGTSSDPVIHLEKIGITEALQQQMEEKESTDEIDSDKFPEIHKEELMASPEINGSGNDDGEVERKRCESETIKVNGEGEKKFTTNETEELKIKNDQEIIRETQIIPPAESLKDSEVIKLLNEERLAREERKWTTFLQKTYTTQQKTRVLYYGDFDVKTQYIPDSYTVKIVKQPKPKIAPDWTAEGAEKESCTAENLQDTEEKSLEDSTIGVETERGTSDKAQEEGTEGSEEDMAQRNLAEQLIRNIESMIDVNAPTEQQLQQMREQVAALSQLPTVIQQTVQRVNDRINVISQREQQKNIQEQRQTTRAQPVSIRITKPSLTEEELAIVKREEVTKILDAKMREEKMKREMGFRRTEQQSRQVAQKSSPRVTPSPAFGRLQEQSRILSRRKWRHSDEAYNEDLINEALLGQAEVIKGNAIGVNFMKYQKPPVPLDHLKNSEVFKAIHEQEPLKKVEMLGPVLSEAEYREKVGTMSPST